MIYCSNTYKRNTEFMFNMLNIRSRSMDFLCKTESLAYQYFIKFATALFLLSLCMTGNLQAVELYIGTATADITPELPVALTGQFHTRIAYTEETPLVANVLALESCEGNLLIDAAIMVSCDLLYIPNDMLEMVRENIKKNIPELNVNKIFLNATHTHTAPVLDSDSTTFSFIYQIPEKGVLQVEDYKVFFVHQVTEAIAKAWDVRRPGSVTWGLGHAVVAYNRRIVYADGSAKMYGDTDLPEFRNLEGMEDHDINTLFFWDNRDRLIAMTINVPCPAQEVEHRSAINADFWHPVREKLKQRFGPDLIILGWGGAAGDQSPRPLYRKASEERMTKLRNLSRLEEIARRIVVAVEEIYDAVKNDRHTDAKLIHHVEIISLPMRIVTKKEYEFSKAERDKYAIQIATNPAAAENVMARLTWNADVVKRFEKQKENPNPKYNTEIHVLRIGDIAICTNQFELFTDYGIRIQARSKALQTFIITFAGPITYLPTEKAIEGGHYSAVIQSGVIGYKGGQILVDRTVSMINEMFSEE